MGAAINLPIPKELEKDLNAPLSPVRVDYLDFINSNRANNAFRDIAGVVANVRNESDKGRFWEFLVVQILLRFKPLENVNFVKYFELSDDNPDPNPNVNPTFRDVIKAKEPIIILNALYSPVLPDGRKIRGWHAYSLIIDKLKRTVMLVNPHGLHEDNDNDLFRMYKVMNWIDKSIERYEWQDQESAKREILELKTERYRYIKVRDYRKRRWYFTNNLLNFQPEAYGGSCVTISLMIAITVAVNSANIVNGNLSLSGVLNKLNEAHENVGYNLPLSFAYFVNEILQKLPPEMRAPISPGREQTYISPSNRLIRRLSVGEADDEGNEGRIRISRRRKESRKRKAVEVIDLTDDDYKRQKPPVIDLTGGARKRSVRILVNREFREQKQQFVDIVKSILLDSRGWRKFGHEFIFVDTKADITVRLASLRHMEREYDESFKGLSVCNMATRVIDINSGRWFGGSEASGLPLDQYRRYVINHEVGHALGCRQHAHQCVDGVAPVMMQQTKGTYCKKHKHIATAQPWPLPEDAAQCD